MTAEIVINVIAKDHEFLPMYSSELAAGADIRAFINEDIIIEPGLSALIPTGLKFEIPAGYEIQVRPRSGLALKNQVIVLNAPGTIDSDYRGEIKVILYNLGKQDYIVEPNARIAQGVFCPVVKAHIQEVKDLEETARGEGGFGSTGV